jgi:hypothetical protein
MFGSLGKYGILMALMMMLVLPVVASDIQPKFEIQPAVSADSSPGATEESGRPPVDKLPLRRGVLRYLDQGFQLEGSGSDGEWWQWIIVDEGDWTIGQLRMVRGALVNTLAALDSVGLDGRAMLSGYRFRRVNSQYVNDIPGRRALVNHGERVILLAEDAFLVNQGFFIYHELGHVVDKATGRALSGMLAERTIERASNPAGPEVAEGFWLRDQARHNSSEAAADAFALWVLVDVSGYDLPSFPTSPASADAAALFFLVEQTLIGVGQD